ncbi:hypothetical protein V6U90_15895 [Micromonospora sp. CPCC 206060]|uniref:hypothetical protein n=1 Tax=Micromonospora sp. CPCC 206060 TaxID=3122406 RepID=UPI002FF1C787
MADQVTTSVVLAVDGAVVVPLVTARAVLPLPPLPEHRAAAGEAGVPVEVELLTVTGPAPVVGAAVSALGVHLEELIPKIARLYYDHEPPHGG